MNLQELQQQIINNKINNLYIFTGEEVAIKDVYINEIQKALDLDIKYIDSYEILCKLDKCHDLIEKPKLYIIISDDSLLKQESSWRFLDNEKSYVILKYNNIDKRSKFYKYFEDRIVEFKTLSETVLCNYIQKEIPLSSQNCKKLISICNGNYNQILLEIDKIKNFEDARFQDNYDQIFAVLDKLGAFYKDYDDVTFEFVDAVVTRNIKKSWQLKEKLNNTFGVLSLLYNNFKNILLIQSCKAGFEISDTTGIPPNIIYMNKDKLKYYLNSELVMILRFIQSIDTNIKRGLLDEAIALDYLLVNIL